jgi:hypothetical protein
MWRIAILIGTVAGSLLSGAEPVTFSGSVKPILAQRCEMCHSEKLTSGRVSVTSRQSLVESGAVVPHDPDGSLLIQVISGDKPRMPKAGPPLSAAQVDILRRWIADGAPSDPAGSAPDPPKQATWWSLRPLASAAVPNLHDPWVRTPVDAFILQKLADHKLSPSPEADRRTLARRLYFDLHGLPPAPADLDAFVADPSPDAYEKLVDRLLASPRYGERWARHWLDVVHYGDSHGYDKDKPRPNAWPYRDYVIRALNEDKPYQRFIQEQIAGDVLYPEDPRALLATGFLAAGPWDFVGHQELREGTVDKDTTRLLDRDDMVATTISTFNSMTAHCARCHNHKFDPIPQQDYYNLQAVFAGIDRADRPYDEDPEVYRRRRQLLHARQLIQIRLQPLMDRVEFASSGEITDLDSSIQDARLLIAHLGTPRNDADREEKARLEARVTADRERRQKLVNAIIGADTYAAIERLKTEFLPIDAELNSLPKPQFVYSGANYFPRAGTFRPALQPRPVHVLTRGSVQSPGAPAKAGALTCVPGLTARFELPDENDEGSRRAALARWISDGNNVLTWRSIVNRIWQGHFGTGIVDTPSDFGHMGSLPSHPELLDWLAVWFRDDAKGSLKRLHKMIVMSAAYRQSSAHRDNAARADADNRLLWRMNRRRIDAEEVRDAVLSVAGKLDVTAGGPPVQMFFFRDDHSPVYDYSRFSPDGPGAYRRSIYRFIVRSVPDPFLERLDCPDASVLTPKRSTTITAIQALVMLNDPFVVRMSEHFAARVRQSSPELLEQINAAVKLVFGRSATSEELHRYREYAGRHGLENLCRVFFNANEFLFVD